MSSAYPLDVSVSVAVFILATARFAFSVLAGA